MSQSIEDLRIYKQARELEDQIYELVKSLPKDQFYALGNDLRRSSAGVSHHIMNTHQYFSYTLKLDELAAARRQAEITLHHLESAKLYGDQTELVNGYTSVIKQAWGLSKWLSAKLKEKQQKTEVSAKEALAAAPA
jgi:four helix bundle protein